MNTSAYASLVRDVAGHSGVQAVPRSQVSLPGSDDRRVGLEARVVLAVQATDSEADRTGRQIEQLTVDVDGRFARRRQLFCERVGTRRTQLQRSDSGESCSKILSGTQPAIAVLASPGVPTQIGTPLTSIGWAKRVGELGEVQVAGGVLILGEMAVVDVDIPAPGRITEVAAQAADELRGLRCRTG